MIATIAGDFWPGTVTFVWSEAWPHSIQVSSGYAPTAPPLTEVVVNARAMIESQRRELLELKRAISRAGLNLNPCMAVKRVMCSVRRGWNLAGLVVPARRARSCC